MNRLFVMIIVAVMAVMTMLMSQYVTVQCQDRQCEILVSVADQWVSIGLYVQS